MITVASNVLKILRVSHNYETENILRIDKSTEEAALKPDSCLVAC